MRGICRLLFVLSVSALAIYESVLGLLQVFGLRMSSHARFVMTGSFDNPGPYGGAVALLLAMLAAFLVIDRKNIDWGCRVVRYVAMVAAALCMMVLPASMSRSAWVALGVAGIVLAFKELNLKAWIVRHKSVAVVAAVLLFCLLIGMFFLKKDSAIGRLHIWRIELRAICENPWTGTGAGTVLGTYGQTQAEFFAQRQRSETMVRVAGCPEYAFNEYLKVGVEHGVPAMLLVVFLVTGAVSLMVRWRMPAAYGAIVFAVFAMFSYPMSVIRFETEAEKKWNSVRHLSAFGLYGDAIEEYESLYAELRDNYRFMYDYGYALHQTGQYSESNRILEEGSRYSSDPMFHNIMGKNYEAMGMPAEAEGKYLHAHYMVPSRLYPLVLLMEMKAGNGDVESARCYAEKALNMPVNPRLSTMTELRNRAELCLDTLRVGKEHFL